MSAAVQFSPIQPTAGWPFHLAIFASWCAEHHLPPGDPDSAEAFGELYQLPPQTDGICEKCGEPAPAAWVESVDWEEFHGATVPRPTAELLGSRCCHAPLVNARGEEIPAGEMQVRAD